MKTHHDINHTSFFARFSVFFFFFFSKIFLGGIFKPLLTGMFSVKGRESREDAQQRAGVGVELAAAAGVLKPCTFSVLTL